MTQWINMPNGEQIRVDEKEDGLFKIAFMDWIEKSPFTRRWAAKKIKKKILHKAKLGYKLSKNEKLNLQECLDILKPITKTRKRKVKIPHWAKTMNLLVGIIIILAMLIIAGLR